MAFKTATVASSKVAGTLSNYPSLVDPSRFGVTTTAQLNSLRYYADSGKVTEYAREVVSTVESYTKITSLTTTSQIYADYDGIRADYAVTDTYGRNAVWSNYLVVYHGALSSLALVDSTGNTTTKYSSNTPTSITGKVGEAFSPNSAWWSSSVNPNTAIGTGDFSVQYWNNFSTNATRRAIVYMGRDGTFNDAFQGIVYESASGNKNTFGARAGTAGYVENQGTACDGTWRMEVFTRTGTTGTQYENGVSVYSVSDAEWGVQVGGATSPILTIAANYTSGASPVVAGALDEFRLRASLLSANWVTTEYNNQSSESTFWPTWSDVSGGGPTQNSNFLMFM